jgi:hypothetical protein
MTVKVVPWGPFVWGVSIRYDNGDGWAYRVGTLDDAEREAERLRG